MKMIMVVCNAAVDAEILDALKAAKVTGYTRLGQATGEGNSDPALGSHVWPSTNNLILVMAEDSAAARVVEALKEAKAQLPERGIKIFSWAAKQE